MAGAAPALGVVAVLVSQPGGKPLAGTVLMLHRLTSPPRSAAPVHATIDQINREFVPDVLVIPVGSTVSFPNTDKVRHQVYSFSPAHRFQLPLYSGRPYPAEHFDRAGLVTLGCNIHDWMIAYILVTDAEYFGSTDTAGRWSSPEIPLGRYRLEWWHPRLGTLSDERSQEVSVSGDHPTEVRVQIEHGLRPAALSAHQHSWDAY
ncbi:MAG: methylamine utilization protein [Steroidobacteraceae bacterium]